MKTKEIITRDGQPVYENMQDMTGIRFDQVEQCWIVPPDMHECARQFAHDTYGYMWIPLDDEFTDAPPFKRILIVCAGMCHDTASDTITLRLRVVTPV